MKWFRRKKNKQKNDLSLTDEKAWNPALWNLGKVNDSGEIINEETALKYSAVFNAVTLIASTIASLPLNLMQRRDGSTLPIPGHPLYSVLHSRTNEYMTAMNFRETLLAHVLTWGNGYAEIVRNGYGQVVELWPIPPNRVIPRLEDGKIVYDITVDGEIIRMGRDKILHVVGLGFDGFVGYSVIHMAAQSLGLGKAMETFGSRFFGAGTHPGVVVSHPNKLSAPAHKNLSDSITSAHAGLGKSHRMLLLEEGMTLEKIGIPPNDSQFIEGRSFQITEVARWFNLPVHKLKEMTKSSFNNIESEQTSFVMDCLRLWSVRLEQTYNQQLLSLTEVKQGIYTNHVLEGLLRGSSKDRAEFYQIMVRNGIMTRNEVRQKENVNPHANPGANELTIEANFMILGQQPAEQGVVKDGTDTKTNLIGGRPSAEAVLPNDIKIPGNTTTWNSIKNGDVNEK